jgi:limonene-1,2-epoxide hydrolase
LADVVGRQAFIDYIGPLALLLSSLTVSVRNVLWKGSLVSVERTERLTVSLTAPIGNPGATYDQPVVGYFEVANNKVTRWSDYWDVRSFSTATGIPL